MHSRSIVKAASLYSLKKGENNDEVRNDYKFNIFLLCSIHQREIMITIIRSKKFVKEWTKKKWGRSLCHKMYCAGSLKNYVSHLLLPAASNAVFRGILVVITVSAASVFVSVAVPFFLSFYTDFVKFQLIS